MSLSPIIITGCEKGCTPYDECTIEDKGLFADVRYFQLGYVNIPNSVRERNLLALTQLEDGERELYLQQASLVRIDTDRKVS